MNPLEKSIIFSEKKQNHFYCIKKDGRYFTVADPKIGDPVYEVPVISGGENKRLLLEVPIPLCKEHQHKGIPFGVKTCSGWEYIAIPVPLGSLTCRECNNELFLPEPHLRSADLSSADLRFADLSSADLRSADLSSADLRSADLSSANLYSANLRSANLSSANLSFADLSFADLSFADLSFADLSFADLRSANLNYANLNSANLRSANLSSARNIDETINLDEAYWNKFTVIDEQFKKLLNKELFVG